MELRGVLGGYNAIMLTVMIFILNMAICSVWSVVAFSGWVVKYGRLSGLPAYHIYFVDQ